MQSTVVLCYSARCIPPFAQVLSTYDGYAAEALNKLRAIDPGCRIPAAVANELAIRQVADMGDLDLGLKAPRAMQLGRAGPLAYPIHWQATVRQSAAVAETYIRSYSNVLNVRFDHEDSRERRANVNVVPSGHREI